MDVTSWDTVLAVTALVLAAALGSSWFVRSDQVKAEQPHWMTPIATTTPRLEQEVRYDVVWQQPPGRDLVENLGAGKGLELIPADNVEVIVGIPAYFVRHGGGRDGFGDVHVLTKYRLIAAPEDRGNYIVTAFLDLAFPTATGGNGEPDVIVTPTIAYGRGAGRFDLQGTFGVSLPAGHEADIGRSFSWNNAIQYRLPAHVWPELEVNATFFQDGRNAGQHQVFVTPGIVVGRLPLTGRVGLTLGAGVQLPVSTFRTSSHNVIVSARLPF